MGNALIVRKTRLPQPPKAGRAAQYVRMSTDYQRYSIENQGAVIAAYASLHQLSIVRTYRDEGISGLKLKPRAGLNKLLDEVKSGRADFDHVLVYDVSRWGRFQDIDESAHHEFVCRQNGVKVIYCAEQFDNDGSLLSSIVKNIKRVMAAEYSRELSVKVHAGQCRVASLGYRVGGPLVFGLRRELIDEGLRSKGLLARGERKALQTDRVRLRKGTDQEANVIRLIFHRCVIEKQSDARIARELNQAKIPHLGASWSDSIVHGILKNENYVGNIVHNRTSRRLGQKLVRNPASAWVRSNAAIEPIVDLDVFLRAQKIMSERYISLPEDQMLIRLRVLLNRKGKLNARLIDKTPGAPSSMSYVKHFGSLRKAYSLIGYNSSRDCAWIDSRERWSHVLATHVGEIAKALEPCIEGQAIRVDETGPSLTAKGKRITFLTARQVKRPGRWRQWKLNRRRNLSGWLAVVRLGSGNREIADYLLLPASKIKGPYLWLSETSRIEGAVHATSMRELIAGVKTYLGRGSTRNVGSR
jgi:DNA invertase Pin-like site-specific DNA recombinase